MQNIYIVNPFSVAVSINLNTSYNLEEDPYKYQINAIVSPIKVEISPPIVRDILKFQSFIEMFSYAKDLKRFRPLFRVQQFIDNPDASHRYARRKILIIRDWMQLVLWYVRLKRASKGATPFKLLEVQAAVQGQSLNNALVKAKKATLSGYVPYYGN